MQFLTAPGIIRKLPNHYLILLKTRCQIIFRTDARLQTRIAWVINRAYKALLQERLNAKLIPMVQLETAPTKEGLLK